MHQSRTIRTFIAAGAALALTFGLTGCGKAVEKLSEKAAEKAVEKAAGDNANVDFDTKDGSFSIETDEGSFNVGGGEVPDDWPSDVPLAKGFTPSSTMNLSSDGKKSINMTGTVGMSVDDVIDFYADSMSGWEETGKSSMSSDGTTIKNVIFSRGGATLAVTATDDSDEGGTTIGLIYNEDPDDA